MDRYSDAYIVGKEEIFTTGYPRCGNTWLDRILSDALRSPLQVKPREVVEYFGPDPHDGKYVVRKTHFYANQYNGIGYSNMPSKMVMIMRDPRDMAVSVMYYRNVQPDLMSVMKSVFLNQNHPGIPVIGYRWFTESWFESPDYTAITKYEELQHNGAKELQRIHKLITGKTMTEKDAEGVMYRQRFDRWKSRYPHSMRKGVSGDWHNHFTQKEGSFLEAAIGDIMLEQGYTEDSDWWKELPKELPGG